MKLAIASVLLAMLAYASNSSAETSQRTLAFVVGIENYENTELNKLEFAADDAKAIYEQLRVVSNIDTQKSALLVADDKEGTVVDERRLRRELQKFVAQIKDNDRVIVYLGGHGSVVGGSLRYLPSDYDSRTPTNYVPFKDIMHAFEQVLNRPLRNVSLTILVNMCNAGNAIDGLNGMDSTDQVVELARQYFQDREFGPTNLAVIPATQRGRSTHEHPELSGSVFAHHLLAGLGGMAATPDGTITAQSLMAHLESKLEEGELPRNAGFSGEIVLGETRPLEGEAEYAIGMSLLAAAQALDQENPDKQTFRHRVSLMDLAFSHFARVGPLAADLAGSAALRQAQIELLRGRAPSIDDVKRRELRERPARDPDAVRVLETLLAQSSAGGLATPKALRDMLKAGAPHHAIVLQTRDVFDTEEDGALWEQLLRQLPGNRGTITVSVDDEAILEPPSDSKSLADLALEAIGEWMKDEQLGLGSERLIVVYTGRAAIGNQNELKPFGIEEIRRIAERWPGPICVFHIAPFGGMLAEHQLRENISLLLAAREKNGMVLDSASAQIADAFSEGVENVEEYIPESDRVRFDAMLRNRGWVPGTPQWLPTGRRTELLARETLQPLKRFGLHVAAGCTLANERACDEGSRSQFGLLSPDVEPIAEDPFISLSRAANRDQAGKFDEANAIYESLAAQLNKGIANNVVSAPSSVESRQLLAAVVEQMLERRNANASRGERKVVIMPVGIADYHSPHVRDLPTTVFKDLTAYAQVFGNVLGTRASVESRAVLVPERATDLLDELQTQSRQMGPDDLLVLVYSGLGGEYRGRRYLAMAGAKPCERDDVSDAALNACEDRLWTELVDLWDIARTLDGKWVLAIYDTQFPDLQANSRQLDLMLEKGLIVKGSGGPAKEDRKSRKVAALSRLARGGLPEHQVHIWSDGDLAQKASRFGACSAESSTTRPTSPLAAALLKGFDGRVTHDYLEWLTSVAQDSCLKSSKIQLFAQGELRLPLFSTSKGAALVSSARQEQIRQAVNLYAAEALIRQHAKNFEQPRYRLAHGAVLIAMGLTQAVHSQALSLERSAMQLHTSACEALHHSELDESSTDWDELLAIRAELLTRCKTLQDGVAAGLQQLRATHPQSLLALRELPQMIVELTEDTARRNPIELVRQAQELIVSLEVGARDRSNARPAASLMAARAKVQEMFDSEIALRAADYSIRPPESVRQAANADP